MTEYVTGQIYGWNGGECPVHPETEVRVWFRNYTGRTGHGAAADHSWRHQCCDCVDDIIAFQVITPYAEPKVIWVNEINGVIYEAYTSEEAARRTAYSQTTRVAVAYSQTTRVAVKFVEVKE
jgi:hypothetical protein